MLSTPPTSTTSEYPHWICCIPLSIACIPEAHCRCTVYAGVDSGTWMDSAATRAMFGASVLCLACPAITSSMTAFSTPDRFTASSSATAGVSRRTVSRSGIKPGNNRSSRRTTKEGRSCPPL